MKISGQINGVNVEQLGHANILHACMAYRHDFGLLTYDEQTRVRDEALYWLKAWQKALEKPVAKGRKG